MKLIKIIGGPGPGSVMVKMDDGKTVQDITDMCREITIHMSPGRLITADVTMFAKVENVESVMLEGAVRPALDCEVCGKAAVTALRMAGESHLHMRCMEHAIHLPGDPRMDDGD